jgi:signal transduction histidine kinase
MFQGELASSAGTSIGPAMEAELGAWSLRTGIAVDVWALPRKPASGPAERIVADVLWNVLEEVERQGRARTVSVALTASSSGVRLTVSDDGGGTSAEALEVRLRGRRVEIGGLGGRSVVNGVPGEGTTVSVAVPAAGSARSR